MFLDIQKIPAEGLAFDHVLHLPALEGAAGESIRVTGVRLKGVVERGKPGADLRAHLDAELELTCGRCLEPVRFPVSTDVFLTLVPEASDPMAEPGGEVADEDVGLFSGPEGKAHLEPLVTEQLYLALPLKTVCDEACKGLCPSCGANRNRTECACRTDEVDPRLAPLLRFKRSGS